MDTSVRKLLLGAHVEATKGSIDQNVTYCSKGGDIYEQGIKPLSQKARGILGKRSQDERWELAKTGDFCLLPPESIKIYEYIHAKFTKVSSIDTLDNIWIQGPTGCGKSKYVRDTYPSFFTKIKNKWWDGYQMEPVVLLDDFGPEQLLMATNLKNWADHYPFPAEVKGGMLMARPKTIIVTSNYRMEEIGFSAQDLEALKRRFRIIDHFPERVYPIFHN
jgi:hypothetical protein